MQATSFYCHLIWVFWCFLQVTAKDYVSLRYNGSVVLGGTVTFWADLYTEDNKRPTGTFRYTWSDNSLMKHKYQTEKTSNTTSIWSISYPRKENRPGEYIVEIQVEYLSLGIFWTFDTSARIPFEITENLNGNISVIQANKTVTGDYITSTNETKLMIELFKGDYAFITQHATSISTYWFIDCKYYGQTNDFTFIYNFTIPGETHEIGALVIASYDPITTTTVLPPTTTAASTNATTPVSDITTINPNVTHTTNATNATAITLPLTVTSVSTATFTTAAPITTTSTMSAVNMSLPYICSNTSVIPPDPNKTYGYFYKTLYVRAPVTNISVEGTNWIQPWDMLSLNVTCRGSGPFSKCLQYHRGKYNVTGNETCNTITEQLHTCNFSIVHYFLEPSVYTILIILNNEVSKQIYPLTINIYKVTTKPQLSVIVVPVSCSLVAVVLIVFGVAYYIQNRARFTVEVADFDFGQSNPDMEYKTFTERLRDSFNNTGYKPLGNPQALQ